MARAEWEGWLAQSPAPAADEESWQYEQRCEMRERLRSLYLDMIEVLAQGGHTGGNAWAMAAFAVWRSMPKVVRQPHTQAELAALLGFTSDKVFYKWMRQYPELFVQSSSGLKSMIHEFLPDVLWAAIQSATTGGVQGFQDRKMLMSIGGMTTERSEQRLTGDMSNPVAMVNLDELSDAQLAALATGKIKAGDVVNG